METKYGKSSIRNKLMVSFLLIILVWGIGISLVIQVTLRQYLLTSGIEEAIVDNIIRNFMTIGLGLVMAAILLSILIAFFLSNYISRPIKELTKITKKIAKERLEIEIDPSLKEKNDEIGDLASAFSQMIKDLKAITVSYDVLNKEVEERKRAEQELKETQEELIQSEKLAVAAQIASEAAHEIKNPLAVIKASLYYLKRILPKEQEEAQKKLFQMDRATERATSYIDNLLSFSRPPLLNLRKVKVNEVIEEALEEMPPEVLESIEIEKRLSPELFIDADPERLKQVFTNIIKNAEESMEKVEVKQLRIETKEEDGRVRISISDTGKGIPEEELDKIFDPFFTTKSKGTGLGLAICKRIIEAHNGKIDVTSELSKGTTFIIRLRVNV